MTDNDKRDDFELKRELMWEENGLNVQVRDNDKAREIACVEACKGWNLTQLERGVVPVNMLEEANAAIESQRLALEEKYAEIKRLTTEAEINKILWNSDKNLIQDLSDTDEEKPWFFGLGTRAANALIFYGFTNKQAVVNYVDSGKSLREIKGVAGKTATEIMWWIGRNRGQSHIFSAKNHELIDEKCEGCACDLWDDGNKPLNYRLDSDSNYLCIDCSISIATDNEHLQARVKELEAELKEANTEGKWQERQGEDYGTY